MKSIMIIFYPRVFICYFTYSSIGLGGEAGQPSIISYLPRSLYGHTNSVEHVAFNGKTIISGGSDW